MNTIGQPVSRVDSRLKVTGRVRYTADIPIEGLLHAAIVHSTIANGRTASIETVAAENAPGVVAVFTHRSNGLEYVARFHGDMLNARPLIELHVFLDLRLFQSFGWLVDRKMLTRESLPPKVGQWKRFKRTAHGLCGLT